MGKKIIKTDAADYVQLEKSTLLATDGTNTVEVVPVEYIQSTGTQYIELGIIPKTTTRFETDLQVADGNNGYFLSGSGSGTASAPRFHFATYQDNIHFGLGSGTGAYTTSPACDYQRHKYKLSAKDGKAYIDSTLIKTFTPLPSSYANVSFKLFATPEGTPEAIGKCWGVKIYEDNQLVLDLIPAKRLIDNEIGMLDLVENKFYHNSGSGAFTGGEIIDFGTPVKQLSTQKAGWLNGDTFTTFPVVEAGPIVYTSRLKGGIETLDDGAYKVLEGETPKKVKLYEKLKYIESTNTNAYIDLGIMSTGVRWELDYQFLSNGQIGCGNTDANRFLIQSDYGDGKFHFWLGTRFATDVDVDFKRHNFILDANEKVGIIDGKSYSYPDGVAADTVSITLFGRHQLGSETYAFRHNAKCFSCKITKNGVTTVFTPAKRLTDNIYGLLDEANMIFYPGVGTITGESFSTPIYVDVEVEKIEYIQTNGTERLDLGTYTFNSSTDKIETVFKFNKLSTTSTATWLYSCETSSSASIDFYSQSNKFNLRPSTLTSIGTHDTNKHKFILDYLNNTYSWDNTTGTPSGQGTSISAPLVLFRRASRGGDAPAEINLYSFMIFKNNVKQFDLRPVKLGGVYCFYDTVSKGFKFLTGSNIKGGTKTLEVERVSDNALGFYNIETHTFTEASIERTPYERNIDKDNLSKFKVDDVEYKKLEYIQSNQSLGNQYIDTNYLSTPDTRYVIDFSTDRITPMTSGKQWAPLFGSREDNNIECFIIQYANNAFQTGSYAMYTDLVNNPFDTNRHVYERYGTVAKLDGVTYTIPQMTNSPWTGYLFNIHTTYPGASEPACAKLYSVKIWTGDELKLDLIPVQRTSDGVNGLFNLITNEFLPNTNSSSGNFIAGPTKGFDIEYKTITAVYDEGLVENVKEKSIKLPDYQVLDYIQSSGTQYIDLGVKAKGSLKVESDFQFTQAVDSALFVGRNAIQNSASGFIITDLGKWRSDYGNDITPSTLNGDTNKHHLVKDKGKTYLDNNLIISVADQTFESSYNLYLFARNSALTIGALAKAKVWYFKVWDNGTLIRDFVPVKRLKDNAIGMLDTLTNTFYGNSGTGTFVAGTPTGEFIYSENPEEVIPVDYIEKNADGPYINLNISNHNYKNFGYETDIYVLKKDNGSWPALYGSLSGTNYDGTGNYGFYLHSTDNQVSGRAGTGNGQIGNHSATTLLNNWCNVIYNRVDTLQELTINGNKQTRTGGNNGGTNLTPFLFCVNNGSGMVHDFQARIRKFKAYENGVLVRDFIPVKYNTEYCLLDLVEMKLYHNAGTGEFTGPEEITTYSGKYERLCYTDIDKAITDGKLEDSFDIKIRALKPDTYISGAIKIYSDGTNFKVNDGTAEQVLAAYDNEEHRIVYDKKNGKLYFNAKAFNVASREGIVNVTNCRLVDYKSFKDTALTSLIFPVNLNEGKALLDIINNELIYPSIITGDREVRLKYISDIHDNVAPEYEECDYIESNGTQYINTGIQANGNTQWEVDLKFNNVSDNNQMGARNDVSEQPQNRFDFGQYRSKWVASFGNDYWSTGPACDTDRHVFILDSSNRSLKIDGTTIATEIGTTLTQSLSIYLLSRNRNNVKETSVSATLYSSKITKDGVVVQHLIPVYNIGLAEYGMYDKVTGIYYGNVGTGAFTGQRKSNPKYISTTSIIPVEYIEATGTQFIDTGLTSVSTYDIGGTITAPYTESGHVYLFKDSSGVIPGNILYAKLYNNGTLVRDYQPVIDLSNNETCLYDKVNDVLYRNQGTGKFNHGHERIIKMDPEYVPISYLESTGTQYIDTGLTSVSTYEIEGTITEPTVESGHVYLFKGETGNITSAKFFDSSNTLVRYFIPAIRTRDLKSGMYCIVTNTFYPNVGSGEFIAGKIL